jgi:hypothetical protein
MNFKTLIALTLLTTMAGHAIADNAGFANQSVRVLVAGVSDGQLYGRLTLLQRCLYVNFAKPTKGGFRSARLSEVLSLQVLENGSWIDRSVKNLLRQEPQECLAESNG